MPTGIRFPPDLPVPLREGYSDTEEDTRGRFEPEVGHSRRRQRTRKTPRRMEVQWIFTQDQFTLFDNWWQFTIKGGALEFDIQLLDDDDVLTWFTVTFVGEYEAEVIGVMDWQVRATLRAVDGTFGTTRPAGTDELGGLATLGPTLQGNIKVTKGLRGLSEVGLEATSRFTLPPLSGLAEVGMFTLPKAQMGPFILRASSELGVDATGELDIAIVNFYPEESRQWMDLDWFGIGASQDINGIEAVVSREWMGIGE